MGAVWLSAEAGELYRDESTLITTTDDMLYDTAPATLAHRPRTWHY